MKNKEFPRRNNLACQFDSEKSIQKAIYEVEKMGTDVLLTDTIVLLSQAKDKVSDYIDR